MEAATFAIFDAAKFAFQLEEHDAYYVHHMSLFEHEVHKYEGFGIAQEKTLEMSMAAYEGECLNLTGVRNNSSSPPYLAFIPFFGGRPPGVTKDLQVKSIGEGNSLVDPSTKSWQAMSTICSCLKYFGQVVVGVARDSDRELITERLHNLVLSDGNRALHYAHIVQLNLGRPAFLPFHLLAWGQQYIKDHNCAVREHPCALSCEQATLYEICDQTSFKNKGNVDLHLHNASKYSLHLNSTHQAKSFEFVYFSESDQIVRFDNFDTLDAITSASNSTCFFTSRRKGKSGSSIPVEYMEGFSSWRTCGKPGYSLQWPGDKYVHEKLEDVQTVSLGEGKLSPSYPNGTLISCTREIFVMDDGRRRPFPNIDVFLSWGFNSTMVIGMPCIVLWSIPIGEPMARKT